MQKSMSQQLLFMKNSNKESQCPHKQSFLNKKMMSTKYCLNKPKLFKEFKKSTLFHHSQTTVNMHQYSQRYTYNQKMNSFEKQNITSQIKQLIVDQSMQNEFQKEKIKKISKLQITKIKVNKINDKNLQNQPLKKSKHDHTIKITESQQFSGISSKISNIISPRGMQTKQREQKRFKIYNRKFIQQFPHKNQKQVLMSYISRNPLDFSPIKLNQISQKQKKRESLRKVNQSCRKFGQNGNIGSKWNLSVQRLNMTKLLSEQDQKYESQKFKLRQQLFIQIDDQIRKFYDLISQLKSLGYEEQKVSQWIWIFCENNKKFLQQIIFKPQSYRNSLANCKVVHKLQDIEQTKSNTRKFKRTINSISIDIQIEDISQLANYLEQILISKQYFELKRIQNQIEDTKNAIKNNYLDMKDQKVDQILKLINTLDENKKFKPLEYYQMLNFYQDAKRLQSHFGNVKGLTSGNKRKFQNITDIQIQLQRKKKQLED